jgi:hypothetical protein
VARPKKLRPREEVLHQALTDVADREGVYGPPLQNHQRIAILLEAYQRALGRPYIEPVDSILFQILTNIARLMETPGHKQTWDNIAGYAGIGYEVTK